MKSFFFKQEGQQRPSSNVTRTTVYAILVINFTVFFMILPFVIINNIWELVSGSTPGPNAFFATAWLVAANSAVNPLIYIPTMRSYRKELTNGCTKLFKRIFKCGKEEAFSGNSMDMSNSNTKKTDTIETLVIKNHKMWIIAK